MKTPLPFLLIALLSGCATYEQADTSTDRLPEFSWDRVPLYMHIRKVDAFTPEDLEYLASFPLITFEKTTGARTYGSTNAGTLEAAQAVKKLNPKAKTLFYRNVIVHYGGYSFDEELKTIEAPFLVNSKGENRLIRDVLHAYDLSNPEVVDWWVKSASDMCADDAIDGLFLDGNIKGLSHYLGRITPNEEVRAAWSAGYDDMMQRTRDAMGPEKLMIANIIRVAYFPDGGLKFLNDYFDGSYLEGFDMGDAQHIARGIAAVQKAARSGKIIAMTLGLGESAVGLHGIDDSRKDMADLSTLQKHIDFCIAMFLVCAEKHSYLYLHDGYCADVRNGRCVSKMWLKRLPQYDRPLGPPRGPAKREGFVFTREFEHCSVRLDLESRAGELIWR